MAKQRKKLPAKRRTKIVKPAAVPETVHVPQSQGRFRRFLGCVFGTTKA